jgi:hypothetical protein
MPRGGLSPVTFRRHNLPLDPPGDAMHVLSDHDGVRHRSQSSRDRLRQSEGSIRATNAASLDQRVQPGLGASSTSAQVVIGAAAGSGIRPSTSERSGSH